MSNPTMTPTTTYTIHEAPSVTHTTTDADVADSAARAGLRVTAVTEGAR